MQLTINDRFSKELPADGVAENYVRQVVGACFSVAYPTPCAKPALVHASSEVLALLGISEAEAGGQDFAALFSGNAIYPGTTPYAMCYGGHQFGHWAGQLGDGRAINLFELNYKGKQCAVQLKGAGKTPYSRTADGLAVLRSSVREYLCSEAMHHLGVPTTRALCLMLSGDEVLRDVLYNGNPAYEKGAIVTRVAPSFVRFGNFQILAARGDKETLKTLADYTLRNLFPHLGEPCKHSYLKWFEEVAERSLDMVVHWERVGFVHGVMNTDNMSILGQTIDYGPYGWLEDFDPNWTPNTTDTEHRRYRFGNQGYIVLWNLYQLANALLPLIEEVPALEVALQQIQKNYLAKHRQMMLEKIGLHDHESESLSALIDGLKTILYRSQMDMTLFFRTLSDFDRDINRTEFINTLEAYSYAPNFDVHKPDWASWFSDYALALTEHAFPDRVERMNATNPRYVLRNYMAQLAIEAADKGDYSLIEELYTMLKKPYDNQPEMAKYFAKRPDWAKHKIGCSQLSCSS